MRLPVESKSFQYAVLAGLVALFSVLTFYHLGSKPLVNYDESIYAQVAREALQNHTPLGFTWVGNTARHQPSMWFEKPPLMVWLVESAENVFGVNEFAARFWTAVFAILTLPLTFLFTRKPSPSPLAPLMATAALFAGYQFVDYARVLQLDIPVGFCVSLSLFAFWRGRERPLFYLLFWTALGAGVMIKSVIGLLPLPVIVIFSALAREFGFLKSKPFGWGALLFLAIVLPWHLVESIRYGREFWHQYLFYHLLQRYSTALEGNAGGVLFYAKILFRQQILFWSLVGSLGYFVAQSRKSRPHLFIAVAVLFIFLFFSAAGTKLPPYILPLYPLAAVMIGMSFADLRQALLEKHHPWAGNTVIGVAAALFVLIGIYHAPFRPSRQTDAEIDSDKEVGKYLETAHLDQPVYFQSVNSIKPEMMFYSNRSIGYFADYPRSKPTGRFLLVSDVPPIYPNTTILFAVQGETVYQIR